MNGSFRIFQSIEELKRELEINALKDFINKLVIQGYGWESGHAFHSTYLFFTYFCFPRYHATTN